MQPKPTIKRNVLFFNDYTTAYLWDETRYYVIRGVGSIPDYEGLLRRDDKLNSLGTRFILARDGLINWSVK